ncbi:hypothetical protein Tco_0412700 [Tanacetum coccineum]
MSLSMNPKSYSYNDKQIFFNQPSTIPIRDISCDFRRETFIRVYRLSNRETLPSLDQCFDQYQPSQFPEIHYPPQTTDTELLQARENLMETIQAFLKEYDHIPPEEKCMALLLAEERFLKIKQAIEEEHNQPEVMQELLLKVMNDVQILKEIQPKQAEHEE